MTMEVTDEDAVAPCLKRALTSDGLSCDGDPNPLVLRLELSSSVPKVSLPTTNFQIDNTWTKSACRLDSSVPAVLVGAVMPMREPRQFQRGSTLRGSFSVDGSVEDVRCCLVDGGLVASRLGILVLNSDSRQLSSQMVLLVICRFPSPRAIHRLYKPAKYQRANKPSAKEHGTVTR